MIPVNKEEQCAQCITNSSFVKNYSDMIDFKTFKDAITDRLNKDGKMHISKRKSNFMWIETDDKQIGHLACHYEFICKKQPKFGHDNDRVHVEFHFEDEETYTLFEGINENGIHHIDGWEFIGLRMNNEGHCFEGKSLETLVDEVIVDLYKIDKTIGGIIRGIIKDHKICNNKD